MPYDLGAVWEPNTGSPRLLQIGDAWIVVEPRSDDTDAGWVCIRFHHAYGAVLGPPNDEARFGHRLWEAGLSEVHWCGEVLNSDWVHRLERQNSVHPRHDPERWTDIRHFVLIFKEDTFEVLCRDVSVVRRTSSAVLDFVRNWVGVST